MQEWYTAWSQLKTPVNRNQPKFWPSFPVDNRTARSELDATAGGNARQQVVMPSKTLEA